MGSGKAEIACALQLPQMIREGSIRDSQGPEELSVVDSGVALDLLEDTLAEPVVEEALPPDPSGNQRKGDSHVQYR